MKLGKHSSGDDTKAATDRNLAYASINTLGMPGILRPEKFANSDQRTLRKKAKLLMLKEN